VSGDGGGGTLGGVSVRRRLGQRLRPEALRIGVEPEDDLGAALRDEVGQPVAEMRAGWTLPV
jgi:hypothetical protein